MKTETKNKKGRNQNEDEKQKGKKMNKQSNFYPLRLSYCCVICVEKEKK